MNYRRIFHNSTCYYLQVFCEKKHTRQFFFPSLRVKTLFPSILSSSKRVTKLCSPISSKVFFNSTSAILLMMSENSRGFLGILRLLIDLSFSLSRLSDDICLLNIVKWQSSIKRRSLLYLDHHIVYKFIILRYYQDIIV